MVLFRIKCKSTEQNVEAFYVQYAVLWHHNTYFHFLLGFAMKFEPKSICHIRNTNMCVNFNMKIYLPFKMIAINVSVNLIWAGFFFYVKSISWLLISTILIKTFHRQSPHSRYGFTFTCFIYKWIMTKQQ